jgi:hypothetical protein
MLRSDLTDAIACLIGALSAVLFIKCVEGTLHSEQVFRVHRDQAGITQRRKRHGRFRAIPHLMPVSLWLSEEVAEHFTDAGENNNKTEDEILRQALATYADGKLMGSSFVSC